MAVIDTIERALREGRTAQAIGAARDGVTADDPDAMAVLAHWHLAGTLVPRDLPGARRLLGRAASLGNADAALVLAALIGNGSGALPDWQAAETLLTETAKIDQTAAAHLALVQAMDTDNCGYPKATRAPKVCSTEPRVAIFEKFLSPAECAHLALSVQDILEPSQVADPRTGRLIAHPIRTSSAAPIGPTRESLPIQAILKRIARATGTAVQQGESLTVLHYAPGQQYREHLDTLPRTTNQRIGTFIIYLNDGFGGGETSFPSLGLTIKPRLGDALYFGNITHVGQPDQRSRHAGLPLVSGVKWVATRWIRQQPFDVWNPN